MALYQMKVGGGLYLGYKYKKGSLVTGSTSISLTNNGKYIPTVLEVKGGGTFNASGTSYSEWKIEVTTGSTTVTIFSFSAFKGRNGYGNNNTFYLYLPALLTEAQLKAVTKITSTVSIAESLGSNPTLTITEWYEK